MTTPSANDLVERLREKLPTKCKMRGHSRYSSDETCDHCGMMEGVVCDEYERYSNASIVAKQEAHDASVTAAMARPIEERLRAITGIVPYHLRNTPADAASLIESLNSQLAEARGALTAYDKLADYIIDYVRLGGGSMKSKYGDNPMDGFDNVVRRAKEARATAIRARSGG